MAAITITIGMPEGARLLAADTERKAAAYAEAIILGVPASGLPLPMYVSCADPAMQRRLTNYLVDLQTEYVSMEVGTGPDGQKAKLG